MSKQIELSQQGKNSGKFVALVDDCDFEFINQWRWYAHKQGNKFYAARDNAGREIKMHRFILGNTENEVDHIDGNGLNNTRSNLRVCSQSENQMNRGKQKNNTTGYKGVTYAKADRKFMAQISVNGKKIHLGGFDTAEKAAQAYDYAAMKYHGEFAKLNKV